MGYRLKGCPKCGGDLYEEDGWWCMQCGQWVVSYPVEVALLPAVPAEMRRRTKWA